MEMTTPQEWEQTVDRLQEMPSELRSHFALLVTKLAACYIEADKWKAAVVLNDVTGDQLLTVSVGATEAEMLDMLHMASDALMAVVTKDAPAKNLYN